MPENFPAGTSITSPGRSASSDATTSSRLSARRALGRAASASESRRRSREYSMKSPRWQVAASAYPSSASSALRSCRASPTTALSAWNCANDDSSSSRAVARPTWCTRFTAMLYDGRNDDLSG